MFKNSYEKIILPPEVIEKMTATKKLLFLVIIFGGLIYIFFTYYGSIGITEASTSFYFYAKFHELWLFVFLFSLIILIVHRHNLFYRAKYFRFALALVLSVFMLTLILFVISTVFMIEPSYTLVHSVYLGHLALFIFYLIKYLRVWNDIFLGEEGKHYAQKLEQHNWTEDVVHIEINGPKDNNEENNRPFYTKAFEKVGNFLVASIFILPTIFAMSATGTGGNIPLYFALIFTFLIVPFIYNAIAKVITWYLFIKRLEKEKNVIIYNGAWLT